MKTQIAMFAITGFALICQAQGNISSLEVHIPEDPSFYSQGIRNALTSIHGKNDFVYGYLKDDCKLSDEEAVAALKHLIDELAAKDSPEDRIDRFQAICCISDYPSDAAVSVLESLILNRTEKEKRAAASTLAKIALENASALLRLKTIMDDIPTSEWERQSVYQAFAAKLQYGGPSRDRQLMLNRFLLDRSEVETDVFEMLDEILCREVPKWRASPQRAENAAKMIREHPNDARLVSFFETVRTNALESARAAHPSEGENADSSTTTNQTSRTSAPSAGSDPWADLLDNLPEKKPWTPPPGYEPPF